MTETHTHIWEPTFRTSRLAGTPHRRCTVNGCSFITLDSDDCDCADFANCRDCRIWAENTLAEGCSPWNGLPIPDGETVEPLPEKNFCD